MATRPISSAFNTLTSPIVLSLHEMIEGNLSVQEIASGIISLEINSKKDGKTPLHLSMKRGEPQLIQMLLERGADPTIQTDDEGLTSFHLAFHSPELLKVLLTHRKDGPAHLGLNIENHQGCTALYLATEKRHILVVEELLLRGASMDIASKKEFLASDIARIGGHYKISNLLQAVKRYGYPLPPDVCVGDVDYYGWKQIDACLD